MGLFLTLLLLLCALALAVPTTMFALECLAGMGSSKRTAPFRHDRPTLAVLVPAHDEEGGIGKTLASVTAQLRDGDRLVVVADNCCDGTARVARAFGAEVVERVDPLLRGKGYALDAGIRHLEASPPLFVVIVDADCLLENGALDHLAAAAHESGRPVQSCYLMKASPEASVSMRVAEFAFLVKNCVRPRGLRRLGLPCQLTGSGMAFPWPVIAAADLAHGGIVEDMQLGLDLARSGYQPLFCEAAKVTSEFPTSQAGSLTQRRRWEEGHLALLKGQIRTLLHWQTVGSLSRLGMAIDLLVPPLTLLVALTGSAACLAWIWALSGQSSLPLLFWSLEFLLIVLSAGFVWLVHGREALPPGMLKQVPLYVLSKLRLYPSLLLRRGATQWIRTARDQPVRS
jgi:cellulose synthase/poly-beta-1,6-N-acetylglucosamine synthase-like glycosyltransferase